MLAFLDSIFSLLITFFRSFFIWRKTHSYYTWRIFSFYAFSFLFQTESKVTNIVYDDVLDGVYRVFKEFKTITIENGKSSKKISSSIISCSNKKMRSFLAFFRGIKIECENSKINFNIYIENNFKSKFWSDFDAVSFSIFEELMINTNIMIKYYKVNKELINEYTKRLTKTTEDVNTKKDVKKVFNKFYLKNFFIWFKH